MCYETWAGKLPSALRSGELSRELWVPGRRRVPSFPWAPSEHPRAECHMLPAMQQESSSLGHQAMKCLWLGKCQQNWANFLTRLDLEGVSGEDKEWLDGLIGKTVPVANLPSTFDI